MFFSQSKSFTVTNMDDAATVVKMSLAQFQFQVSLITLSWSRFYLRPLLDTQLQGEASIWEELDIV